MRDGNNQFNSVHCSGGDLFFYIIGWAGQISSTNGYFMSRSEFFVAKHEDSLLWGDHEGWQVVQRRWPVNYSNQNMTKYLYSTLFNQLCHCTRPVLSKDWSWFNLYISFHSPCSSSFFCSFSQASNTKLWKVWMIMTNMTISTNFEWEEPWSWYLSQKYETNNHCFERGTPLTLWVNAMMPPVEVTLSHSFNTLPKLVQQMFNSHISYNTHMYKTKSSNLFVFQPWL